MQLDMKTGLRRLAVIIMMIVVAAAGESRAVALERIA